MAFLISPVIAILAASLGASLVIRFVVQDIAIRRMRRKLLSRGPRGR